MFIHEEFGRVNNFSLTLLLTINIDTAQGMN